MKAFLLVSLLSLSLVPGASRPAYLGVLAAQNNEPQEPDASENSPIQVENWATPESGWLYVLDPRPNAGALEGRVWLLDPVNAKIRGSIRTGRNADFALSPDGSRLYIASDASGDLSDLAVIDTAQGVVLNRGTIENRAVTDTIIPAFSAMAVSGDGLALRILIDVPASQGNDTFFLATLDTQTAEFLPESVRLYGCGYGRFIYYPTADQFGFLCPLSNRVRLISVDGESRETRNFDVLMPWERRIGVAEALMVPGGQDIAIVRGDGAILKLDGTTRAVVPTSVGPDFPARVLPAAWPTSPDGSKVYLGYNMNYSRFINDQLYLQYGWPPNARPDAATAGEFRVFDTQTWQRIGRIKTSMPFWSAVAANDGKLLYAIVPKKHRILVIDANAMREIRTISIGGMPSLALVAP